MKETLENHDKVNLLGKKKPKEADKKGVVDEEVEPLFDVKKHQSKPKAKPQSGLVGKKVAATVKLSHVTANPKYANAFQPIADGKYVVTADTGNEDWGVGTIWQMSDLDGEPVLSRVVEDTPEHSTQILAESAVGQKLAKTASLHVAENSEDTELFASNVPLGVTEADAAQTKEDAVWAEEEDTTLLSASASFEQIMKVLADKKPPTMSWSKFADVMGEFLKKETEDK